MNHAKQAPLWMSIGLVAGLPLGYLLHAKVTVHAPVSATVRMTERAGVESSSGDLDRISRLRRGFADSRARAGDALDGFSSEGGTGTKSLTRSDMEETQRLGQLRLEGECVLSLDNPVDRREAEARWARAAERSAKQRLADGHPEMYSKLGLSDAQAGQLDRHLSQIQKASAEAEAAIGQWLQARDELNARLGSLLSGEQIAEYQGFERSLKAGRETELLQEYFNQKGVTPGDQEMAAISELIVNFDANTFEKWGGPFDDLPAPAVGYEQVALKMRSEAARIAAARERVLAAVGDSGISREMQSSLDEYLRSRQEHFESIALGISDREGREARIREAAGSVREAIRRRGL